MSKHGGGGGGLIDKPWTIMSCLVWKVGGRDGNNMADVSMQA